MPEVVRYEQQRSVEVVLQVGDDREDLGLDEHVEGGRRLVGDHEPRPEHQCEGDHDPLAHAARELVGIVAKAGRRDADTAEGLERAPADLVVGDVRLVGVQRLGEVVRDPHERVEPGHRLLEDEADRGPRSSRISALGGLDEVAPFEVDVTVPAGAHGQQAEDPAAEGRLAAAGLADQPQRLAGRGSRSSRRRRRAPGPGRCRTRP